MNLCGNDEWEKEYHIWLSKQNIAIKSVEMKFILYLCSKTG
jgi:hypothetical protein